LQAVVKEQKERVFRTANLLDIPVEDIQLWLAGECWDTDEELMDAAKIMHGYGVLHRNGVDLDVLPGR
jgi:hypothetical protein